MNYLAVDSFYPEARQLRSVFDKRFADPLRSMPERFMWDYWHVPGEYTALRTPAYHYFPKTVYERFHRHLVRFGREQLGCHDISPPWLSCYIEGCRQEPHRDLPHGPLAYVYSLTPWARRKFSGGETFIVRPRTLIEPKFNRLTIFNPALVHGVRHVKGTHDPREGRLVIHGWFVNPRAFWTGPLGAEEIHESISEGLFQMGFSELGLGHGMVSLRLKILPSGTVQSARFLINTLTGAKAAHVRALQSKILGLRFPAKRSLTRLTLPLMVSGGDN